MIIILFGVSGSGKTTVGRLLAERLGWDFLDADDFHSPDNVERMRSGLPLDDDDRKGWLVSLRKLISEQLTFKKDTVLACSALKKDYREYLTVSDRVKFVFLKGDYSAIEERLKLRHGHFMNPNLLKSQFQTLEEPTTHEFTVDANLTAEELVKRISKLAASNQS